MQVAQTSRFQAMRQNLAGVVGGGTVGQVLNSNLSTIGANISNTVGITAAVTFVKNTSVFANVVNMGRNAGKVMNLPSLVNEALNSELPVAAVGVLGAKDTTPGAGPIVVITSETIEDKDTVVLVQGDIKVALTNCTKSDGSEFKSSDLKKELEYAVNKGAFKQLKLDASMTEENKKALSKVLNAAVADIASVDL